MKKVNPNVFLLLFSLEWWNLTLEMKSGIKRKDILAFSVPSIAQQKISTENVKRNYKLSRKIIFPLITKLRTAGLAEQFIR